MKLGTLAKIFMLGLFMLAAEVLPCGSAPAGETLELSLSDCVTIGLLNNIDIKIAKIESKIQGQNVLLSEAIFDTLISGKANYADDQRAAATIITGTKSITTNYGLAAEKKLPTGTTVAVDYLDTRTWSDSSFITNNPYHEGELSFSLTQPVLRNFFGYIDRRNVKLSIIEAELAGIKALDRIENTVADIEKAYWVLVFTYQNVALREELLDQAEELYRTFEGHLKTGLVESTQFYETEANMKTRQTELLIARNEMKTASNNLLFLLNHDTNVLVIPRGKLETLGEGANLVESLNQAFIANRDYRMKKKELSGKKIKLEMKANNLWPEIDLVGTLAVNGISPKFEKATRRLTTDKSPMYYGGVEFSMPLENRNALGEYRKASLEKEKVILEIIQTEKDIATTIDEKVRDVNLYMENTKRWSDIRQIQFKKFQEEKKKLEYGRSDSKTVIDYQNDLTLAALREYLSVLQYYKALIDLENAKDTLLHVVGVLDNENI